jgi:pilus assembly protein CpaE
MRTFVASDNDVLSLDLIEHLRGAGHDCQVSRVGPVDLVVSRLTQARPELLVVVLSPDPEAALTLLRTARGAISGRVLAIGPASEPKLLLRALREGADQYLDEADLRSELDTVLSLFKAHGPAAQRVESGRLISLLAPSGGSGSSTLAANVATVLAKEHKSCMLLDLKLGAGDLASLLDLKPTHTLADICQNSAQLDRSIFERSLVRHASGVALLSPPRSFADIGKVTTQGVKDVLAMARTIFPYVVADLDDYFHQEQTQTLRLSDIILLVLRLDFTSLRNARRTLEHLDQMSIGRDRVRLVVNRYGQPKELPYSKAEEALGMKVTYYIPDDPKTINRANNSGVPAVLESPSAKVSRSVMQLAQGVNGRHKV